jgi:hypothetical protein
MKRGNIFSAYLLIVLLLGVAIVFIRTQTNTAVRIPAVDEKGITIVKTTQPNAQVNSAAGAYLLTPFETELALRSAPLSRKGNTAVKVEPGSTQSNIVSKASAVNLASAQTSTAAATPTISTGSVSTGTTQTKKAGKGSGGSVRTEAATKTTTETPPAATSGKTQENKPVKTVPEAKANKETATAEKTSNVVTTPPVITSLPEVPVEVPKKTIESALVTSSMRTLYVDGLNGNDATANGSSAKPWKTIKKALGYLKPGDVLSIMGGVYKERFTIKKSGTPDSRIIIGAFGNGEVIIDGSPAIGEWALATDTVVKGIYKATSSFTPRAIVVNEQPIFPAFSLVDIKEGEWYYDKVQTTIYLLPPAGVKPSRDNIGVISDNQYNDAVLISAANYVTLYGLTVKYAGGRGISILGSHNEIIRCNVKFNGGIGINMFNTKTLLSTDNIVSWNHIYHNFLRNWPRGLYKWGGWGGGSISHGTSNPKFVGNVVHKNGGEGLVAYDNKGASFENNISYDNWSVNIYVSSETDSVIDNNLVFSSEPDQRDLYHNGDSAPNDNRNFRRLRPEGIMTADESAPARLNNIKITNNNIVGCRRGINHYGKATGSGLKNVLVSNNTIIVPDAAGAGESFVGLQVPYNNGNNKNVVFEDNLIYATNASTYLLYLGTDPTLLPTIEFSNITFKGNTWYHAANPKPFHIGPDYHTIYDVVFNKWHTICAANCFADSYSNITAKIKPILDKIASIKATYK